MKMLFVINPCSGKIKIKDCLFDILKIFGKAGYTVTVHLTTKKGNAAEVAEEKGKDYDIIVCCGGDGTLNEVITGMLKGNINLPLGYIPAGSTNDFARTLGLETDLIKAAKVIAAKKSEISVDMGKFGKDRYFSYIASFGLFTSVSYKTQQSAKNALGHIAYVLEGISDIGNINNTYHVLFEADGKKFEGDYIYGGITNSTSIGGMVKFDPNMIDLNDGLFEILMVKSPQNANDFMKIVTGISYSDFSDSSVFDFVRGSKIKIEMPSDISWTLDGEEAKGKKKFDILNLRSAIRIIK
ncbi:MAG: diacylglycerol kinase family lipid kinase [Clostridia bacterium]|nr:diacylglycerol kinase family lipid kinase [Clostridia bacterium]